MKQGSVVVNLNNQEIYKRIIGIAELVCNLVQKHSVGKLMQIENPTFQEMVLICEALIELLEDVEHNVLNNSAEIMRVIGEVSVGVTNQCDTTLIDCVAHLEDLLQIAKKGN
jgi:hypothetical protein